MFCINKLKTHGMGLWLMQGIIGAVMFVVALSSEWRYGFSVWYTDVRAGGQLGHMQWAWSVFNLLGCLVGVKTHLALDKELPLTKDHRLFMVKIQLYWGYFTWAFGVWTTAVVFSSFRHYTFTRGIYPADLTFFFLTAAVSTLLSDLWALSKLCSLSAYAPRLGEEWRCSADPVALRRMSQGPTVREADIELGSTKEHRSRRKGKGHHDDLSSDDSDSESDSSNDSRGARRERKSTSLALQPSAPQSPYAVPLSPREQARVALTPRGDEDVLLPHVFERYWTQLPTQGSFKTAITEHTPKASVVQHLSDKGFQVVAAGSNRGIMKVLFCSREQVTNGIGAWFLGELIVDTSNLCLGACFKCEKPELVPGFVTKFRLKDLFAVA
ncbi:unnamed protein product [Chrysoparadoxa australica]